MTRTILTFGDSNTFGTPPMDNRTSHPRIDQRWPVVMAGVLGCTLVEAGVGGRTAGNQHPSDGEMELDGPLGLKMALRGCGPIDDLVIMLGTNDLQTRHGNTAASVAAAMSKLMSIAHSAEMQDRHDGFRTTLICPPPILEGGTYAPEFAGAAKQSAALPGYYQDLARNWDAGFLDAGQHIASDPLDGVHFGAVAHDTLGRAVADLLARRA